MSERHGRIEFEPDTVERDLVKLVLTVVELLRQLMERQALRRFDQGDLSEDQEERIGLTLMLLDDRMTELRERYGLRPEDLNLDLGPLDRCCPGSEPPGASSPSSSSVAAGQPPVPATPAASGRRPADQESQQPQDQHDQGDHQSTFKANPAPKRISAEKQYGAEAEP
ncbi:hypothetical protein Sdagh_14730 [Streptomyces daghestanicus]|uniref:Gas vesicle protein K n=1 Tax=Streptomyces daghestanicus TaxID=66885 RepID=A0ABQ3PXJ9_9ACTN|nr:hypothetical protein Sdagh_14730 [Streptomyces daghestanicus]